MTGFEPAASCSQSRRATNCATPGYFVILSGWSYSPKPGAIPTSLYPDIHFSVMIPRRAVKIKFFLSVVIYVVKGDFVPLSAIGENPENAGVARLSGISPCPVPDTATALPNQARYQLRYTRISTGGAFAPPAYCTLLSARTQGGSETFFHPGLPPAGKTAPQASSASRRQTLTPAMARAKTNQKMLITRG